MTKERFNYLMKKKWLSYNEGIEMPEYQDNASKFVLAILEEKFDEYFQQIHDIIENAYDELNLTPEERNYCDKKWRFDFDLSEDGKCLLNIHIDDT